MTVTLIVELALIALMLVLLISWPHRALPWVSLLLIALVVVEYPGSLDWTDGVKLTMAGIGLGVWAERDGLDAIRNAWAAKRTTGCDGST